MTTDPYAYEWDTLREQLRRDFMLARPVSPLSLAIVTGITDGGSLDVEPPAWRRFYSQFTLGERERIRDRQRHGRLLIMVTGKRRRYL